MGIKSGLHTYHLPVSLLLFKIFILNLSHKTTKSYFMAKNSLSFFGSIVFVTTLLFISCQKIEYPGISSTTSAEYQYGQFIWHDLVTPNPEQSMKFYGDLFNWTFKNLGDEKNPYHVIYNNGKPIGGIIGLTGTDQKRGEWLSSISVPDVDKAVSYNLQKGGKTMMDAKNYPGRGRAALVQDPQGAYISFVNSSTGDPAPENSFNSWLWNELWTSDMDASVGYYQGLVPYQPEKVTNNNVPYTLFKKGDQKLSGIMKNPVEKMRAAWVPYIRVNEIAGITEKASSLGASILLQPSEAIRNNTVAIIQDPIGAPFAIQIWNN